ncbi:hypothetical protein D3C74_451770 [compost metagenome]
MLVDMLKQIDTRDFGHSDVSNQNVDVILSQHVPCFNRIGHRLDLVNAESVPIEQMLHVLHDIMSVIHN